MHETLYLKISGNGRDKIINMIAKFSETCEIWQYKKEYIINTPPKLRGQSSKYPKLSSEDYYKCVKNIYPKLIKCVLKEDVISVLKIKYNFKSLDTSLSTYIKEYYNNPTRKYQIENGFNLYSHKECLEKIYEK